MPSDAELLTQIYLLLKSLAKTRDEWLANELILSAGQLATQLTPAFRTHLIRILEAHLEKP